MQSPPSIYFGQCCPRVHWGSFGKHDFLYAASDGLSGDPHPGRTAVSVLSLEAPPQRMESLSFSLANQAPSQLGLEDPLPLSPHPPLLQIQDNVLFSASGLYLYLSAFTFFSLVALPLTRCGNLTFLLAQLLTLLSCHVTWLPRIKLRSTAFLCLLCALSWSLVHFNSCYRLCACCSLICTFSYSAPEWQLLRDYCCISADCWHSTINEQEGTGAIKGHMPLFPS